MALTKAQHDTLEQADVDRLVTQEVAVTTDEDVAPQLPATAEVVLNDGEPATVPVTGDPVDAAEYAEPGQFAVEGRVRSIGNNLNESSGVGVPLSSSTSIDNVVTATVTVEDVEGGPAAPVATTPPAVTGTAMVGRRLEATSGTWDVPGTATSLQWLAGGVPVPGATGPSYVVRAADVGKALAVRVTATAEGRPTGTAQSASTAPVARAATATTLKVTPQAVRAGGAVRVVVTVRATGVTPTGAVKIRLDGKVVKRLQLSGGTARTKVTVPARGRHQVVATYAGTTWTSPSADRTTVRAR